MDERMERVIGDLELPSYVKSIEAPSGRFLFYQERGPTGWESLAMRLGWKYGELVAVTGDLCDDGDGMFLQAGNSTLYDAAKPLERSAKERYGKRLLVSRGKAPIQAHRKRNLITAGGKVILHF